MISLDCVSQGFIEVVDDNFQRYNPEEVKKFPIGIIEPFYRICKDEELGEQEAVILAYESKHGLLIVAKTIQSIDYKVIVNHYNYHPGRKQVTLSHTTTYENFEDPKHIFSNHLSVYIEMLDNGIPSSFKTLLRLFEETKDVETIPP